MDLTFGIPSRQTRSATATEKHPTTPVVTIESAPLVKGKSSRIMLNKTACNLLGLDFESGDKQYVSFAFQNEGTFVVNTTANTDLADKDKNHVRKNGSIADKKLHTFMTGLEGMGIGEYELVETNGYQMLTRLVEGATNGTTTEVVEDVNTSDEPIELVATEEIVEETIEEVAEEATVPVLEDWD